MRAMFGIGTARTLQADGKADGEVAGSLHLSLFDVLRAYQNVHHAITRLVATGAAQIQISPIKKSPAQIAALAA